MTQADRAERRKRRGRAPAHASTAATSPTATRRLMPELAAGNRAVAALVARNRIAGARGLAVSNHAMSALLTRQAQEDASTPVPTPAEPARTETHADDDMTGSSDAGLDDAL